MMLAVKTLAAADRSGLTLIFDEVDVGIGGRVADVVGTRLRALGDRFQVLCITHLPQIAARATTHFQIDKAVKGSRTVTSVSRLDHGGRREELARMLGGASVTDVVRESAQELLDRAAIPSKGARRSGAKDKAITKGESESRRHA